MGLRERLVFFRMDTRVCGVKWDWLLGESVWILMMKEREVIGFGRKFYDRRGKWGFLVIFM